MAISKCFWQIVSDFGFDFYFDSDWGRNLKEISKGEGNFNAIVKTIFKLSYFNFLALDVSSFLINISYFVNKVDQNGNLKTFSLTYI